MRDFITGTFALLLVLNAIIFAVVGVAWLFDCKPINLYMVWEYCYKSLAVCFLLFILFGGFKRE